MSSLVIVYLLIVVCLLADILDCVSCCSCDVLSITERKIGSEHDTKHETESTDNLFSNALPKLRFLPLNESP